MRILVLNNDMGLSIYAVGDDKSFSKEFAEVVVFDGVTFKELDKRYPSIFKALVEHGWKRLKDLDDCGFTFYSFVFERECE